MLHFLCIGAQKAGTTWLYENLCQHPEISFPAGKEVHFWDMYYDRGAAYYQSLFKHPELKEGDITPAYATLPTEKVKEIHQLFPKLKIVFIIRNPIDRAWSGALMALKRAEMQIGEASDQWFIDHFLSKGSQLRTQYLLTLERWGMVFPKEQLLTVQYEQIGESPHLFLTQVYDHLGLDSSRLISNDNHTLHQRIHGSDGHEIRTTLKKFLVDHYRELIIALKDQLGFDYTDVLK